MAMFFNTNAMNNSNSEFDLASLVTMSSANAEGSGSGAFGDAKERTVTSTWTVGGGVVPGSYSRSTSYTEMHCFGWFGWCW